jgi:ATP-dependent DNA ligase
MATDYWCAGRILTCVAEAVRKLRVKSVLLDGEGIVYNSKGMPDFSLLHGKQNDEAAQLIGEGGR